MARPNWIEGETLTYVQCCYGEEGADPGDCTVRIGVLDDAYVVDAGDDDERDHVGTYASVDAARAAAQAYVDAHDEGGGLSSDDLAERDDASALARATPTGRYAVVMVTPANGAEPAYREVGRRYDDSDDAQREVDAWFRRVRANNPGSTLLWGLMTCPEVVDLGDE